MPPRARSAKTTTRRTGKGKGPIDPEKATRERYAKASQRAEAELCCAPTTYHREFLANIPQAIREIDYGCGDPTRYAKRGDTVVDLGSGSGKHCYLLAQFVGKGGRVIGVDFNPPMLALAKGARKEFAAKTGLRNVDFVKARIQDLALDLDALEGWMAEHPIKCADDLTELESETARLRREQPAIGSDSVDLVVSNCVLNLARDEDKPALFREMFRVLKRGGRCVISDIVSDEEVPPHLKADPELWSGCISGAMTELGFVRAFEEAGFHGIEILSRDERPWKTIEGIEFRSVTVRAWKGKQGPCIERNQAVIYRGPWKEVRDDDGHVYHRGERTAVCEKTFQIMASEAYGEHIIPVPPLKAVKGKAKAFDCSRPAKRHPRETKGKDYNLTAIDPNATTCDPANGCC